MRIILTLLILAAGALALDYEIAALGLVLVVIVLRIGDLVQDVPDPIPHSCKQGRRCNCAPSCAPDPQQSDGHMK
jgi:hypothetical protein